MKVSRVSLVICLCLTFLCGLFVSNNWGIYSYRHYFLEHPTKKLYVPNSPVNSSIQSNLSDHKETESIQTGDDFGFITDENITMEQVSNVPSITKGRVIKTKEENDSLVKDDVTRNLIRTTKESRSFQAESEALHSYKSVGNEENIQSNMIAFQTSVAESQVPHTNSIRNVNFHNWRNLSQELYQLAPHIFDSVPKEFLHQFKNPCWYDDHHQLLCLPNFYILGFPKCGTSDLLNKINQHPQVHETLFKDVPFWRDRRIGNKEEFEKYIANALPHKKRLFSGDFQAVYGDGTASTITTHFRYVPFFPNVSNGMYTTADILKEITPKAKMIVAIREPVERLYSGYLFYPMEEYRSQLHFHNEAVYYLNNFQRCLSRSSMLRCIFEKVPEEGRAQRLKGGIFAPFIKDWVKRFGVDQLMVIRLEDWKMNCASLLPQIFCFLELGSLSSEVIENICRMSVAKDNSAVHKSFGGMFSTTKQLLQDFYAPFNEELSKFLNIPVYHAKV